MKIFDGKLQALKIEQEIKDQLKNFSNFDENLLAIVQIGDDLSSEKFIKIKVNLCNKIGIKCCVYKIDEKSKSDEDIFYEVKDIFKSREFAGGIIQLPIPRKSLNKVLDFIPLDKDIDVISTEGKKRFYDGDFSVLPPVISSFTNFISANSIKLKDLKTIVIGDGELVGKPVFFYLSKTSSSVKVLSNYDGKEKLDCDLLVLCAGVPNLVKGENISKNCNVVDFGSSIVEGKCVGDLDLNSNIGHLNCVSKSPGGMGPLVVRYLLKNWVDKALKNS